MLQHTIGGVRAGSQGKVYGVDIVGDRLLRDLVRGGARVRGLQEPSLRFLNHRLAIADCHATLVAADRTRQIELTDSAVEPASWRTFTGTGGARLTLKPDLYVETATADDLVHAWFLEIDLGTESIPTLLRKCRDYEAYRCSGIEQDRHGSFPLVIWSMTHQDPAKAQRRRQALTEAIAADRTLTNQLFQIIAPEQLLPLIQRGATR